ncbi:Acetylxylan esterase At 0.90 angstrom resolution [Aspergillus granulosus]|uniref:Acetylxylan esterase At 0.90 angstrom resolution n=1 Tax=Aspergillus granulosus TaxID=176169 RepID=A0ABR4HEK5_9EURO
MHWQNLALPFITQTILTPKENGQSCPRLHIFGARETLADPGYGLSSILVDTLLDTYPGSTAEAIDYPACGGHPSCGGATHPESVAAGINAAALAVNAFNSRCPRTQIVLVGYSMGGEVLDATLCGGGVPIEGITNTTVPLTPSAVDMVRAAIFMGEPLFRAGLPYSVGTCAAGGFDARPVDFVCPSASKVQSYCDAPDPYCCNGTDSVPHYQYNAIYGKAALGFVQNNLD